MPDAPTHQGTSRPRAGTRTAILGGLVVVVLAILTAQVALTARDAQAQATALKQAFEQATAHARQGTLDLLPQDLKVIDQAASDLQAATTTWQWQVLSQLPGLGPTADAIPTISETTRTLAQAAQPLAEAAAEAPSTLALVQSLPELEPAVRQLQQAAEHATADLSRASARDLRFGLTDQLAKAQEATKTIQDATTTALDAWPALQGLLGFDGPRTYLVMLQNPAEARGSGGLFSAFMRVTLDQGAPTIDEANTRKVLDDTRIPIPDDIDQGERQMWGDYLTRWASFNTSPDFPTTARLAQAGMQARQTPVDGVIAIDPFTVEAILAGTGPVEHEGVTIDSTSAADFFTKGIYEDFPGFADVDAKDELALGLLYATVDAALTRPLDIAALSDRLPASVEEGHLKAWVPNNREQFWLDELGLAHDLATTDPATPVIALNNAVGGKVDAYVTATATQLIDTCTIIGGDLDGWHQSELVLTLANTAPQALPGYVDTRLDDPTAPRGSTKLLITTLGAPGILDASITLAGVPADYASGQSHGRPFWVTEAELLRGERRSLTLTTIEPPGTEVPTGPPQVIGSASPTRSTTAADGGSAPCPTLIRYTLPVRELRG